jgi:GntR family transcriptional regulator
MVSDTTDPQSHSDPAEVSLDESGIIDLDSAVPYYYQLQRYIEHRIKSEAWRPGQKLPTEKQLCDRLGVSRTVVRQALNAIASQDLITTYKGRGSFVADIKHSWHLMQTMGGFYDDAAMRGEVVHTRVLELGVIPASGAVAESLALREDEPVIRLRRLRFIRDEPVMLGVTHVPEHFCPSLTQIDFSDKSFYRTLESEYGLVIATGIRTIEAINAPPEMAALLQIEPGAALSVITSIGYLKDGTPFEYFTSWHRGDRSRFEVRLVNPRA